jgi:hypothetical protein
LRAGNDAATGHGHGGGSPRDAPRNGSNVDHQIPSPRPLPTHEAHTSLSASPPCRTRTRRSTQPDVTADKSHWYQIDDPHGTRVLASEVVLDAALDTRVNAPAAQLAQGALRPHSTVDQGDLADGGRCHRAQAVGPRSAVKPAHGVTWWTMVDQSERHAGS